MATIQVDLETLQKLVVHEPLAVAGKHFSDQGSERMKGILLFLRQCARYATVHDKSDITVFAMMQSDALVDERRLQCASAFEFGITARGAIEKLIVEIRSDGSPYVWQNIPEDICQIVLTGIAYRLQQGVETFSINGISVPVTKVIPAAVSQFLVNYFSDLKDALKAYRNSMARTSKCHLLREAWADENRLSFLTKPEYRLRRALANYLYSYLRHDDIELREEQNVDDSHPVDIKILWRMENRSAIIEVKWVGKSVDLAALKFTQTFTDARARRGAKQLAEYLEWYRQQAAKENTRGYLVIFDCRRKGLKAGAKTIAKAHGFHYEGRELKFDPEFHKHRKDFEEPIRMFLEPVCV